MAAPRPEQTAHAAAGDVQPFHGDIQIRQVQFAYDTERRALDGLELEIPAGQHIAIVGPSGSGKSTLASLLLGFIGPDRGQILIGERELTPANIADWRSQISWIPQRARLFHGSVADNIRLGAPDVSLSRILDACEDAHAMEFIEQLPQGIDTLVGEGGQGLSGGQVQRIAIARALVRDTRWLLLDEPSAHLDPDSERLVTDALARLAQGRTLISIAHRLQTVRDADRIVVLRHGRIVQQGDFAQLAATPGVFRELLDEGDELL